MATKFEVAAWLSLTIWLVLASIGGGTLLYWACVVGSFATGFLAVVLYQALQWSDKVKKDARHQRPLPLVTAMDEQPWHHHDDPIIFKVDKRLTGATLIDAPLQDCINYMCRDYVEWFYYAVGAHPAFLNEVQTVLRQCIINFSTRAKEVEWVPFFTKRIPDDFASHLRLYRQAEERLRREKERAGVAAATDSRPSTPLGTSLTSDSVLLDQDLSELEEYFFQVEKRMEHCLTFQEILTSPEHEKDYLRDISEVVLYLLLPEGDFENKVLRQLLKEMMVNTLWLPLVERMADADYVNQTITWLLKPSMFTEEIFTHIVKTSRSVVELEEVMVQIEAEIAKTREHDDSGDGPGSSAKQTLDSLSQLKALCVARLDQLHHGILDPQTEVLSETSAEDTDTQSDDTSGSRHLPPDALPSLPLEVVLTNVTAVGYFYDFLEGRPEMKLVSFWLNCEGFRASAQQKIQARRESLEKGTASPPPVEDLRQMAMNLYDSCLEESVRLSCFSPDVCQYVWSLINTRPPSADWFDEAQKQAVAELDRTCYPEYQRSVLYSQCLRQLSSSHQNEDADSASVHGDDGDVESLLSESMEVSHAREDMLASGAYAEPFVLSAPSSSDQVESLSITVPNSSISRQGTKSVVHYTVHLYCKYSNASNPVTWSVLRRYSDFVSFHLTIMDRFSLSAELPPKRAFNNLDPVFLERRRQGLEAYLKALVSRETSQTQPGILEVVINFAGSANSSGLLGERRRQESMRRSVKKRLNVTSSVTGSIAKAMKNSPIIPRRSDESVTPEPAAAKAEDVKMSATINEDDNIPLRILLLLMDEVFDFATTNRWLRRHVIVILRGLVKKTFGDTINRKIVDQVEYLTSAEQISEFIKVFRESYWPNGIIGPYYADRPRDQKVRTEVAAKVMLLGGVPDELKRFIGATATEEGILRVFDMFQYRRLNKRLFYLIMEAFLETLFRGNRLPQIFKHLHSASRRTPSGS